MTPHHVTASLLTFCIYLNPRCFTLCLPYITSRLGSHHYEQGIESMARSTFHCHPKGTGVICKAKEGLAADTFISEYLG